MTFVLGYHLKSARQIVDNVNGFASIEMKAYLKSLLRPYVGKRLRALLLRARGIRNETFAHETVAALVAREDPTILDIGCNDGSDSLALLRLMPQAKIYCFEPDPRAVRRFKERFGAEIERVNLFEIAVGDRTANIEFFPSTGAAGDFDQAGSIRRPKHANLEAPWLRFKEPIKVRSYRLDDWCAEHAVRQIDFIWMDVQGAEADVIAGAEKILPNVHYIYTEYSNNELYEGQLTLNRLLARLPEFEVVVRYPGDILLRNKRFITGGCGNRSEKWDISVS